jgi:predicted transcriptional regulator
MTAERLRDGERRRRDVLRSLAELREARKRSQTSVAAAMATSQSAIARLESTASDAKLSTVERYAASLGYVVQYHLVPAESAAGAPSVVVQES